MKFSKEVILALLFLMIVSSACGTSSEVSVESPSESEEEQVAEPEEEATKEVGTARSNPAPVSSVVTADNMSFKNLGSTRSADDKVMAGNIFNTEPEEGEEYIIVEIKIDCFKDQDFPCNISQFNFKLIGDEGVAYNAEFFVSGVDGLLESEESYRWGGCDCIFTIYK